MDDSEELRIGICGMEGVGKTSQAVHIHNKLIENSKTCDQVFWCTISKDHDYSTGKLQSDIAKCLKLDLSNEYDEKKRAAKLSQAFARREKCVLFLDDVWDKIDLHRVRIPNGCKLILTTRSFDVCRKMGCEQFKVEPLSEEEAWNLFWAKLCNGADTTLSLEVIAIAKFVAAKCDGLPLGIITMAGSMRGVDDIREWENVLEQLKELTMGHEDMEKDVLPALELSYSRLNDTKLKHCFLNCALYLEDKRIPRNELIRYFIVEGLIDTSKSLIRKSDKGHTILNKLERSSLLEHCINFDGEICVKMHDLIRDMALKITETNHPRVMVKAGVGLKEIPDLQEWARNLEKVSLMRNNIQEIPCSWSPRCHSLSTLILKGNLLVSIAASFFKHMHALQVLDLSNNHKIEVLPNSISDLVNLTALLLTYCTSLTYVPPLGKLRALEELDLSFTRIKEVPQGMDMLVNLRSLMTPRLEKIPSGTLSRLSHLQLLRLQGTPVEIQVIEEFEGLTKLEEFAVRLEHVHSFNRIVKFLQHREVPLDKYFLQLGVPHFEYKICSKLISWRGENGIKGEEGVSFLPYDLENLGLV